MSNAVYPSAATLALTGGLDVTGDTIKIQAVNGYTYSAAHNFLDDVTTLLSSAATVTVTGVAAGVVSCSPITFTAFPAGDDIEGFVVFVDSGAPGTSSLLCHIDMRADYVPIIVEPTGGDITLTFADGLFRL